ncbi:MAG TPA: glycosyltransferase [Ohtaekwangia sp.]|nr:glycosyltransferase [Ohtaekwangia sp.]
MHEWDDDRIYQRACLGLARNGLDVHLVATGQRTVEEAISPSVTVHLIKPRKGIKRRYFSSKEAITISIKVEADIYHFHDPDLLPHIKRLKSKLPQAVVIYDIHENYVARFYQWRIPVIVKPLFSELFRRFELQIIRQIDGFSAVSESLASLFKSTEKPYVIVRNSVDISRLAEINLDTQKFDHPVIYTSGSNSDDRNIFNTVKALPLILKTHSNVQMMFVGKYVGNAKEQLTRLAHDLNVKDRLVLGDMLPWEDNFIRTAKAFCGCVFYKKNANNDVTIPNRIYEYMYCGIPVVASDYPELRKIVETANCGILVNADDPNSIAAAINLLLSDMPNAAELGKNGRKAIQEIYGYHNDLATMIKFYSTLKFSRSAKD